MYKLLLLFSLVSLSFCSVNNQAKTIETTINKQLETKDATSFIFVRHAEKEKDSKNPSLTDDGQKRAKNLSKILRRIPLDAIYSSDYKRTKETAIPTAQNQGLQVLLYNPSELEVSAKEMLNTFKGGKILVVGHSNTTPEFVNFLSGSEKAPAILETEYDNLYIVTVFEIGNTEVVNLRY